MIFAKRKRSLLVIAAVMVLAAAASVWRPWEARYKGKPASYWINQARQNQKPETIEALKVLWPEAAMPLLKGMKQTDSALKSRLIRLYDKAPSFFQRLITRPRTESEIRFCSYSALNLISDSIKGPQARPLIPILSTYLADEDRRPSSFVDAETHYSIPHGVYVRSVSADILGSIGPDAAEAVPALVTALNDDKWNKYYRFVIPRTLGKVGAAAKLAVPPLQKFLEKDPETSPWTAEALWRIDASQSNIVNGFVLKAFSHTNRFTRVKAARVHWRMNHKSKIVLPILIQLMKDPQNLWVIDTMRALQDLGSAANEALPILKERLEDNESVVRTVAAEVITSIELSSAGATDASGRPSK